MDLESLSVASISAFQRANVALEMQVAVAKKVNEHTEVAGQLIVNAISAAAETGKGGRLNVVA